MKFPLCSLTLAAALLASSSAFAKVPATIQLNCQSPEIGRVEITLSQPQLNGEEIGYYAINAKRFNARNNQFLGEVSYPVDTSSHSYRAEVHMNEGPVPVDKEPMLILGLPAFGVNWKDHSNSCYVKAPTAGFQFSIGLKSKQLVNSLYREPIVNPYETNPDVSFVVIPGIGFGEVREVLNNEYCPNIDAWKKVNNITCELSIQ